MDKKPLLIKKALKNIPFYYMRHGLTDWNLKNLAMGQYDIPLNADGVAQATAALPLIDKCQVKTICHSSLQRTKQTAEIVNRHLQSSLVEIDELKECNWGPLGGSLIEKEWIHDWLNGRCFSGTEPYSQFLERTLKGINLALACPPPVLIVGHGFGYRTVLYFAKLDVDFHLPHCTPIYHIPPKSADNNWQLCLVT